MKSFLTLLFFGLIGGIIGSYFFISLNMPSSADISQTVVSVPTVSVTPSYGFWEKIISESAPSSVGIQVFQSNRLVKQGSGIIVSSDGLIATVGDLAVSNAVYQIFYEDKILRGKIAAVDYGLNLALIKTENLYSNVADLSSKDYRSGQEVILIGNIPDISRSASFSQKGMISYVAQKSIIIDTLATNNLVGAGVVNSDGDFIGLTYLRNGKANMIQGAVVGEFFKVYINKIK